MHRILINYLIVVFAFFDRQWRRQFLWIGTVPLILLIVTGSLSISSFAAIISATVYLVWLTVGNYFLIPGRVEILLKQEQMSKGSVLIEFLNLPELRNSETFLKQFINGKFVSCKSDDKQTFHGIISSFNMFSRCTRFRITFVEIDGKKFIRKCYCPSEPKFYQSLRNNLIIKNLAISPQLKYVNVSDRTLWIEFIDGYNLGRLSKKTAMSHDELEILFRRMNEFLDSLHRLGLCYLDLTASNIIIRKTDGQPFLIDLDKPRLHKKNSILYKVRSRIDRQKLNKLLAKLLKRNKQNMKKNMGNYRNLDSEIKDFVSKGLNQ